MAILVFLTFFVCLCSAQMASEIAYDLFDYGINDTQWNGGIGFQGPWRAQGGCTTAPLSPSDTPAGFTIFAKTLMIGSATRGLERNTCTISRSVGNLDSSVRFVSVVLIRAKSGADDKGSPTFGIAVGDLNLGEFWNNEQEGIIDIINTTRPWLGARAFIQDERVSKQQIIVQTIINNVSQEASGRTSPSPVLFVLIDTTGRSAVMNADDDDISQAMLGGSFPFTLPSPWGISIGVAGYRVAQVRVGKTFASVYGNVPSTTTTTTTTATTTTKTSTTTTTTTSLASLPTTTSLTSLQSTPISSTSFACQSATTCLTCVALDGCKWCERWRNASTDLAQCIAELDSECLTLTLSTDGCGMATLDKTMDEASLPVAIIAGAIGGGVALLLLIALIVCLVMRSRRNKQSHRPEQTSAEMVTARESTSIAYTDETYGDLRLTRQEKPVYTTAGLTLSTQGGGSVKSETTGASGSGGDPHYLPMQMH